MAQAYSESEIDYCLLTLYRHGGNAVDAADFLRQNRFKDEPERAVSAERLKRWRTGIHRARYVKIAEDNAEDLEREIVVRLRELATQTGLMQLEGLESIMTQIKMGGATPHLLKELSIVSGVSIDKLLVLSGRPQKIVQINNPDDIIKRLVDAGYAEVVDGTAEEFKELPPPTEVIIEPEPNFAGRPVEKPPRPTTVRNPEKRDKALKRRKTS